MSHQDLNINQDQLVNAWSETMPRVLKEKDKARVWADEANPHALRLHITAAGHSKYTFDFKCTYVDNSEVHVDLVDVERDNVHVDERNDTIQEMVGGYVRDIHECASQLKNLTSH